ncbi:MAG: CheR family methyltransferase [Bacteriovoracaceae bacterium]
MTALKKVFIKDLDDLSAYLCPIVTKVTGNILGPAQVSMVKSRLRKHLGDLEITNPEDYVTYFERNYDQEINAIVSLLTTHHTFFFREFPHFEFLLKNLDTLVANVKARKDNKLRIYSAACSRGQEVYSIAMFLQKHVVGKYPGIDFEILGSDIDPVSVQFSKNAVYPIKEVGSIPVTYLGNHWQKGTGEISEFAKVKNDLKKKCRFEVLNLLDLKSKLGNEKFDIIFCRNVFIYFDPKTISNVLSQFRNHLFHDGLVITGLSESLSALNEKVRVVGPNVYSFNLEPKIATKAETVISQPMTRNKIKLLLVDDSVSVLKILTRIFSSDPDFEVLGTAGNGIEATEFLKKNRVDVMILDIHMPEMDGIEYLEKNFSTMHPKVIMCSSASREDARYAQKSLALGAIDFIEKPAMNKIDEKAEELKMKIKTAMMSDKVVEKKIFDAQIKKDFVVTQPEKHNRLFFSNSSDIKKLELILKEQTSSAPPIFVFFDLNSIVLETFVNDLSSKGIKGYLYENNMDIRIGNIYFCNLDSNLEHLTRRFLIGNLSISALGFCPPKTVEALTRLKGSKTQIMIEDLKGQNSKAIALATDLFPWTSFSHIGTEYLAKKEY